MNYSQGGTRAPPLEGPSHRPIHSRTLTHSPLALPTVLPLSSIHPQHPYLRSLDDMPGASASISCINGTQHSHGQVLFIGRSHQSPKPRVPLDEPLWTYTILGTLPYLVAWAEFN